MSIDELCILNGYEILDIAIVDWVFVDLRDKADSTIVKAARPALIKRDGKVVDWRNFDQFHKP